MQPTEPNPSRNQPPHHHHCQVPPAERLAALSALLEAATDGGATAPFRPLPRLAVLFVTAQLKVSDLVVILLCCVVLCVYVCVLGRFWIGDNPAVAGDVHTTLLHILNQEGASTPPPPKT